MEESSQITTSEAAETKEKKTVVNTGTLVLFAIVLLSIGVAVYFVLKQPKKGNNNTVQTENLSPEAQLTKALEVAQRLPNVPNLVNLGLAYFNNGKYIESISIHLQVLQIDSNLAVAYNNICAAYNNLGRYEEAIFFCKKALEKDPQHVLAKNNIAFAEKQIKRVAELQQKVRTSAAKEEFVELGIYYYKRKEFHQAIEVFSEGLKKFPKDLILLNNLCASHCELKQWDEALPYCEEALRLQPDYSLAKNNLQWAKDGKAGKYN